jgi:hypothetical protein
MFPHQVAIRGELWYGGAKVDDLLFVSGSVSEDRNAVVRRTFTGAIDPRMSPTSLNDKLTPWGSYVKVWRGIRFPNNEVTDFLVFTGRIEEVDFGRFQVNIRCSDLAADVADARFEAPRSGTKTMTFVDQIKALITEAVPSATFNVTVTGTNLTKTIVTPATWDRERTEALDGLALVIGAEWYAQPDGVFAIAPSPAITESSPAVWIVDAGDTGVVVERGTQIDRAGVYNAVVVNGEPPDGQAPAYGVARDTNPVSLVKWGGPYGKVPRFFSTQFITTNADATAVALSMLGDAISGTRSVTIRCVVNPKLRAGDIVFVQTEADSEYDGMYFIHSLTIPLEPESPMSLVCNTALAPVGGGELMLQAAPLLLPEGVNWNGHKENQPA